MTDVSKTVDEYLAMWNERDPVRRGTHIARAWGAAGRYVDPLFEAEGHTGMSEMVSGVQAKFPDHRFRRTSGIDLHHDQLRFAWELVSPDGTVVAAGVDVGVLGPDGRLSRLTGFFGELPALSAA